MPTEASHTARVVGDFAPFLRALGEEGFAFAVIGGCAVGVYARLGGEVVTSTDLDLYVSGETLRDLLAWAPRHGVRVVKLPKPRNLPVAVLDWNGEEVNALTETRGLAAPEVVVRSARDFVLSEHGNVVVPIADPFDLLANKLALDREKDRPHVEVLRRFVEEEIVAAFGSEQTPRERQAPARRLLAVLRQAALPDHLAERLLPLAHLPADFRFLLSHAPSQRFVEELLRRAPAEPELREDLAAIQASLHLDAPSD